MVESCKQEASLYDEMNWVHTIVCRQIRNYAFYVETQTRGSIWFPRLFFKSPSSVGYRYQLNLAHAQSASLELELYVPRIRTFFLVLCHFRILVVLANFIVCLVF